MTSRHQNISPSDQINQRQISTGVSTPPPPQQYYQGFQQNIEFAPQSQQALYKAYGSVVNESRAPSNGARVGPPQPNLQPGASFYSQPNQNMRPPQPQQPQATQQYFISTPAQPSLRPRQQPMAPQPAMVYIQPYNQGNNVVIPNMYAHAPRYPLYQPQPTPGYSTYPTMYYNNGWTNPGIPQATAPIRPQAREKRIISITDPESGRNITDEIINNRQHSVDSEEHSEDMPAVNQEICKTFTRLVADRLKPPEETISVTDTQSGGVGTSGPVQASQYQQPPPQQVQQPNPAHVPASHIRPNMSHMMRPDLTQPPPQIRQATPAPLYNPQQGSSLQGPRLSQIQQQPLRPPMPQISGVQQQTAPVIQHREVPLVSQTSSAPHVAQPFSSGQVADFVPLAAKLEVSAPNVDKVNPTTEAMPLDIPAKPVAAVPVQISKTPSPTSPSEEPIFPQQEPVVVDSNKSILNQTSKDTTHSLDETNNPDEASKEESSLGASQAVKDGKKNKKSKKDINRKEIVGTEMDAFIDDKENEESASKPPLPPGAGDRKGSLDKKMTLETKAVSNSTPDAAKEVVREASPQATVLTPAAASTPAQPDKITDKLSVSEPDHVSPVIVQDSQSNSQINQEALNQNQPLAEQPESTFKNRRQAGQTVRQNSQPFDNDMNTEKVNKLNDLENDGLTVNHVTVSEENELPTDTKTKGDDRKKGSYEDNISSKPVSEKTPLKGKKDGKDKLIYDRAHLMELRECPASLAKPEGLPNLEIILDRPNNNPIRSTTDAPDFTPGFFQQATSNNQRHTPQIGKSSSRGRQRPGDVQQMRIIKSVSLQNDVKPLHQSEKPWKPTQKQSSAGELAEPRKSLESEVLFIMNRLTPTNFERLATEMRKLNIQTYEDLQELVKIFFDKVTMETKFVEAYALLCKVMSALKVPPPPGMKENQATFRVVMLTKCQQEFEADKSIIFEDPEEKKRKIESEMPEGNERNQLIESTLYLMKLKRLKFYGNIRFIGELFKLGMLTENIMHDCIYRLLKARDDDSLVSLCQLLTTVGHALDTDKAKARMDQYFHQMAKIAEERKSRIKFTLKDAIDLRSNNWVPRKEQTGPKKIDEVHKDFQQEQFTKQLMQSQPLPPRNDQAQPNSRRGSRQRQDEIKQPLDDGWNTVGSKSLRIDASKMKLSKNVVDENSIQLGPGGGASKFSMWGRGSLGAQQQLSQDDRPAPAANRFSLLRGGEEDRRNFQRSPSRGDSVTNRGVRQGPSAGHGRGKILSRSSTEGERKEALANARSQNSSRDNSWNREEHRQFLGPRGSREGDNVMTRSDITLRPSRDSLLPPNISSANVASTGGYDNVKKLKPLSVDEMEQKAKTILEEYLSVKDLEEAKLCLRELEGQTHLDVLVSACINDVLEKTKRERELTGQFFHEMVKNKLIPLDLYLKGLTEVLQYGEDMVIDIPMIWAYLAELIAPLLIGGSLPLLNLSQALQSNLERRCCAKLLAEILIITKEKTSENELAQIWQSSGLNWSAFIDEADIDRFLQEKKLTCTVAPLSAANISSRGVGSPKFDFDRVVKEIEKIAKDGGSSKEVFSYVEKNIPVDSRDKDFIRALTTAIASASITPAMKANEEMIKNHKDTLHNYIKNNQELELQALYAIQALMHRLEHPSGVIVSLFEVLYDEEVISEEACKRWEKSTDPLEAEGKGACSMQLTHFFAWLRENDEPEASS